MNESVKLLAQIFMFQNVLAVYDAEAYHNAALFQWTYFLHSWCGPIKLFGIKIK